MQCNFFVKEDFERGLLKDEKIKHAKLVKLTEEYRQRKNAALTKWGPEHANYLQMKLIYNDLLQKMTCKQKSVKANDPVPSASIP
ncbi:MAG: hypothetical protein P4M12_04860 [Gammaproteobacteria bacterium]|nr:hypothetical protein [Gammaproteobacteria bacterium]